MPKKPINIGIVGLGFMASMHVKTYRQIENARIAAICNPSGRNLDGDFSKVAGNVAIADPVKLDMSSVKATKNLEDLLNDPAIDLIDICAPTMSHPEMAIAALKAGKHVICEKPLARTSALARKIADEARDAKGVFMPAMCVRFWPEWMWLKQAIEKKIFGKVLSARFRRVAEPPAWGHTHFADGTKSGGALLDLHIHDTDFVQFCFGSPESVFSQGYTKFSGAIDHVVTQYNVASGAIVHAEGSWAMARGFGFNMAYTANFETATVDYDFARPAGETLKIYEEGKEGVTLKLPAGDGYLAEMQYLFSCIENNTRPTTVSAQDAAAAIAICEAEERSIGSGLIERV